MKLKKCISLMLVFALSISMAACGSGSGSASSGSSSAGSAASSSSGADSGSQAAAAEDSDSPYVEDGTYRYLYSREIATMNYLTTSTTDDFKSSANFVDTLIEYDQYGIAQPCLAESWETSDDGLTWTFHLREGVKWVDYQGNEYGEVTANDFVFPIKYILTPENESTTVDNVCGVIKNAREYYTGQISDFSEVGVRAIDDYTLEYTLSDNCPYFLSVLTYVCFMPANEEFVESCGDFFGTSNDTILYNGAYLCESWEPQAQFIWTKNESYWDIDNVHIARIEGIYNAEAESLAPEMYKRGEIDEATISTSILDAWLADDATKDQVRPNRPTYDAMWWFFDFDPHFDDPYDEDNYRLAVNNTAWRKSIACGIDKVKAMSCYDPYNPETNMMNTITPPNFVSAGGKDFTQIGPLADISNNSSYDPDAALQYKEQAIEELSALGCTFPVVVPYYYRTDEANQDSVAQVVEQQVEGLLGSDYIDFVLIAGPATNYTSEVRKPGKYGFMEEGWGPDYADPSTYAEPWGVGWSYNWPNDCTNEEYRTGYVYTEEDLANGIISDEAGVGKYQMVYDQKVLEAMAETTDIEKRYELFAEAEAWLIEEAFVIPLRMHSDGYVASKLTVFDGEYSPFGVCVWRYKGKHLLKEAMSMDEYVDGYAQWEAERAAALEAAG